MIWRQNRVHFTDLLLYDLTFESTIQIFYFLKFDLDWDQSEFVFHKLLFTHIEGGKRAKNDYSRSKTKLNTPRFLWIMSRIGNLKVLTKFGGRTSLPSQYQHTKIIQVPKSGKVQLFVFSIFLFVLSGNLVETFGRSNMYRSPNWSSWKKKLIFIHWKTQRHYHHFFLFWKSVLILLFYSTKMLNFLKIRCLHIEQWLCRNISLNKNVCFMH